ncbi:putative transmembrane protein [Senna tora]|uniref:Putative transmembrane protein n=1 Tax=Senna tora TaxID=362788 RepID=A0A834SHU0_9FABA|nr:putative transmembrane protein [Senna tora]
MAPQRTREQIELGVVPEMDQGEEKMNNKYHMLVRGSLHFVMWVCVFCLVAWYFCGFFILPFPYHNSFNAYFFSMIPRTLQRKYMFLICNAILAFLATSSISSSPTSPSLNLELQPSDLSHTNTLLSENASLMLQQDVEEPKLEQEHHEQVINIEAEEVEEAKNEASVAHQQQEEEEQEEEEEEEDEAEDKTLMATNEERVNTEELNRKFEEFIRRMKEEIRIEARSQLIAV